MIVFLELTRQIYYQDYENLSEILTAVRILPMTVTGIMCNFFIAFLIGRVDVVFLIGPYIIFRLRIFAIPFFHSLISSHLALSL